MVSPALNVTRWTLFGTGILYGFFHDRSLKSAAYDAHAIATYKKKEEWIAKAKEEYRKLHPKKDTSQGVEANYDDPNFDVSKYIEASLAQLKSS